MIKIYSKIFFLLLAAALLQCFSQTLNAQCHGSVIPGDVAYDTTVSTGSGNYSTVFSFPKFDPSNGMVTCVKLCLTITGRVSMFLENNVNAPTTYNITYNRNDTLTGPGLSSPMKNNITVNYGPYLLAASDGTTNSGPDYMTIGPDTVLRSVSICITLTDSIDLVPFYGVDSVNYTYKINESANVAGSGDYNFGVSTQGSVNYKLQYCYCPTAVLPLNIKNFSVTKKGDDRASVEWTSLDDPNSNYHYEVEVSKDGYHFSSVGSLPVNPASPDYRFLYVMGENATGKYFFRLKQVYSNGYTRFSEIKYIDLERSTSPKFTLYPNPSEGPVGIKFDNIQTGQLTIQIFNTQGQKILQKEIDAAGSSYRQLTVLQKGMYWLKVTDNTSRMSDVSQLFIK